MFVHRRELAIQNGGSHKAKVLKLGSSSWATMMKVKDCIVSTKIFGGTPPGFYSTPCAYYTVVL